MANKGVFTKILAGVGTALVWVPLLAPVLFAMAAYAGRGRFLFDYLMPAELFPVALAGGGLLLWTAFRARAQRALLGSGLGAALILLVGGQALAVVTGLATGETQPGGWQWTLVLVTLALYTLALATLGVGGALLVRQVFQQTPRPDVTKI
jgi:hypothetical protein